MSASEHLGFPPPFIITAPHFLRALLRAGEAGAGHGTGHRAQSAADTGPGEPGVRRPGPR